MYFHGMESVILETGIAQREYMTIASIITQNPNANIFQLQGILLRVFGQNIKSCHYMVFGYLIGYRLATDKTLNDFTKHNSVCQRQN